MADVATGVFALHSPTLDRWIQVGIASGSVIRATVHADRPEGEDDGPVLAQLRAYLEAGEEVDLAEAEIALTVPTDHRAVYETVREIPYGRELPVADVLARTGTLEVDEGGAQTVRTALGANPIPIFIPGHRVSDAVGAIPADVRRTLRTLEGLESSPGDP